MFTPRSGAFKRPNRLALTLSANNRPEARNLDTNAPTTEADLFRGAETVEGIDPDAGVFTDPAQWPCGRLIGE